MLKSTLHSRWAGMYPINSKFYIVMYNTLITRMESIASNLLLHTPAVRPYPGQSTIPTWMSPGPWEAGECAIVCRTSSSVPSLHMPIITIRKFFPGWPRCSRYTSGRRPIGEPLIKGLLVCGKFKDRAESHLVEWSSAPGETRIETRKKSRLDLGLLVGKQNPFFRI